MPTIITDGRTKVWHVPTIANIAAPTTSELNAGTSLECTMTPDGLIGFEPETADVDTSALCSTFGTNTAGRASFSSTMLRLMKAAATGDTIYDLLVRDLAGYIVIRRDTLSTTAWASTQKVEVYPVVYGEVRNLAPEANAVHKYEVPVKISTQPNLRAAVA